MTNYTKYILNPQGICNVFIRPKLLIGKFSIIYYCCPIKPIAVR